MALHGHASLMNLRMRSRRSRGKEERGQGGSAGAGWGWGRGAARGGAEGGASRKLGAISDTSVEGLRALVQIRGGLGVLLIIEVIRLEDDKLLPAPLDHREHVAEHQLCHPH